MRSGEMIEMSATLKGVWKYLTENVPEDGKFVSYGLMRDKVGKKRMSRHAIAYAVEKLIRLGKIRIYDRKIYVLEDYKEA